MSTARETAKARADRAAAKRGAPKSAAAETVEVVRTKPVRTTVDYAPREFDRVSRRVLRVSMELGRKTSYTDVARALLRVLRLDEVRALVVAEMRKSDAERAEDDHAEDAQYGDSVTH